MIYNGIDLGQIFSVTKIDGLAPSIKASLWSPTLGNGDRISIARQPNKTIKVSCVVETDDAGSMADKVQALYSVFRAGKEYVDILFDEVDDKIYKGRVTGVSQTAYWFTVAEYSITLTCLPFRYGFNRIYDGSPITGRNTGTAPSTGVISFTVADDPDTLTIQLVGTEGAVQLVKPSDGSLDGAWVVDIEKRTVYKDGALAMTYLSFENTRFDDFLVDGDFQITFSEAVTAPEYVYQEVFL